MAMGVVASHRHQAKNCIHKTKKKCYSFCRNIQKGWRFFMNLSIFDEFQLIAEEL
jgi:hypothetical protein